MQGRGWGHWEVTGAPFAVVQACVAAIKVLPVVQKCCNPSQLVTERVWSHPHINKGGGFLGAEREKL